MTVIKGDTMTEPAPSTPEKLRAGGDRDYLRIATEEAYACLLYTSDAADE